MWVEVYDEKFRLNMKTGKNLDKVLLKMQPLVKKLSREYSKQLNLELEDLQQEIYILIIDGLYNYDSSKDTKLSTFIHYHLDNKLITMLRAVNAYKRSASYLHIEEQLGEFEFFLGSLPISLSFDIHMEESGGSNLYADQAIPDENNPFPIIDFRLSMDSLLNKYEKRLLKGTRECMEGIFLEDSTIKDGAERVGLSPWAMSNRFKTNSKLFNDLLLEIAYGGLPANSKLTKIFYTD